jgi:hypothetical protein
VPGGGKGGGKGDKKGKKPSGRWIKVGHQLYETSGTDNNTYDSDSEEDVSTVASSTSLEAQGAKSKAKARKAARLSEGPPTQSSASSSWDVSGQCAVNPGGGGARSGPCPEEHPLEPWDKRAGITEERQGRWRCTGCKLYFFRQFLAIAQEDKSYDWQGTLNLLCFDCTRKAEPDNYVDGSEASFKKFKRMADHTWVQRKHSNKDVLRTVREIGWNKAKQEVGKEHGEKNSEFRARLWAAAVEHVKIFNEAFQNVFTMKQQADAKKAFKVWVNEQERKAKDPTYVPQLTTPSPDELFNDDMVLQFIDEVVPGMHRFYLCRHKTCGLITHSSSWVKAAESDHYRCPSCTEQYRPWKEQPGYMPAQMVAVTEEGGRTTSMMLCTWPDTATKNLENELKIISHDLREELRGKDYNYIMEYVQNLNRNTIPACFEPMTLDPETRLHFERMHLPIEQGGHGSKKTWPVTHLLGGFHGTKFTWDDENPPPVKSHVDIMREWAYARWWVDQGKKVRGG